MTDSLLHMGRSLQCPPNSCRNPVIPVESGGFWRNELWHAYLERDNDTDRLQKFVYIYTLVFAGT